MCVHVVVCDCGLPLVVCHREAERTMTAPLQHLLPEAVMKTPKDVRRPFMIRARQTMFREAALTALEVFPGPS